MFKLNFLVKYVKCYEEIPFPLLDADWIRSTSCEPLSFTTRETPINNDHDYSYTNVNYLSRLSLCLEEYTPY